MRTVPVGVRASKAWSVDGEPGGLKFLADVVAGLLDGGGAGRARTDLDHLLQVRERALAVEFRRLLRGAGCVAERTGSEHAPRRAARSSSQWSTDYR